MGTLRLGQAAALAGVCTRTIRRWVDAGIVQPAEITAAGEKRYRRADILELARLRRRRGRAGRTPALRLGDTTGQHAGRAPCRTRDPNATHPTGRGSFRASWVAEAGASTFRRVRSPTGAGAAPG